MSWRALRNVYQSSIKPTVSPRNEAELSGWPLPHFRLERVHADTRRNENHRLEPCGLLEAAQAFVFCPQVILSRLFAPADSMSSIDLRY
jgi:hypothetical protein